MELHMITLICVLTECEPLMVKQYVTTLTSRHHLEGLGQNQLACSIPLLSFYDDVLDIHVRIHKPLRNEEISLFEEATVLHLHQVKVRLLLIIILIIILTLLLVLIILLIIVLSVLLLIIILLILSSITRILIILSVIILSLCIILSLRSGTDRPRSPSLPSWSGASRLIPTLQRSCLTRSSGLSSRLILNLITSLN
jgi:hypothetical protein